MGHPDQYSPDNHRTSNRDHAPEPNVREDLEKDLDSKARRELKERAETGTSVRTPEPDEGRTGEAESTYVGRQMADDLKENPRPRRPDQE